MRRSDRMQSGKAKTLAGAAGSERAKTLAGAAGSERAKTLAGAAGSERAKTLAGAAGSDWAGSVRGFTLVELIVAVIVGTVVAGATTTAVMTLVRGKNRAIARHEAHRRAETAVSRVAMDLQAVIRDRDLAACRVMVTDSGPGVGGLESDGLLLFTRSLAAVRGSEGVPEGADREVQYKLVAEGSAASLWRRTQAGVDDYSNAGGVATPVVDGIVSFSVRAMDRASWFDAWDSDSLGMPHALAVTAVGVSDDGTVRATARRVVAIDRVPIAPEAATETTGSGTTGTTGGAATGTTTGGGR
jgi:type II secretion system protein J